MKQLLLLAVLTLPMQLFAQQATSRPELQRLARVYLRLLKDSPVRRISICSPENANKPMCLNADVNSANAWVDSDNESIVFTTRAAHDLQSDDEIACVMAHEAGHIFSPKQKPYTTPENILFDEQDADWFSIPLVMARGYDAKACTSALLHISEQRSFTSERAQMFFMAIIGHHSDLNQTAGNHGYWVVREARIKREIQILCTEKQFVNSPTCEAR